MHEVLIYGHEDVERSLGKAENLGVGTSQGLEFVDGGDRMSGDRPLQTAVDTLVK